MSVIHKVDWVLNEGDMLKNILLIVALFFCGCISTNETKCLEWGLVYSGVSVYHSDIELCVMDAEYVIDAKTGHLTHLKYYVLSRHKEDKE